MTTLALIIAASHTKPPAQRYDDVKDITYYSTGSVRIDSMHRYEVYAAFRGKVPAVPTEARFVLVTWHGNDSGEAAQDADGSQWDGAKEVAFRVVDKVTTFSIGADGYHRGPSTDEAIKALLGRVVYERVEVTVPWSFVLSMSTSDALYECGLSKGAIKGKGHEPIAKLVAAFAD